MYFADCSASYFRPDELPWAVGMIRYLSPPPAVKNWTPAQIAEWRGAGKAVAAVWETSGTPTGGALAGDDAASAANALADELGWPHDVGLFYAPADHPKWTPDDCAGWWIGARGYPGDGRRPFGAYGSKEVVEAAIRDYGAAGGWMVETWWAQEPRPLGNPFADLVQIANASSAPDVEITPGTDANLVRNPECPCIWLPSGPKPQPTTPPPETIGAPMYEHFTPDPHNTPGGTSYYDLVDALADGATLPGAQYQSWVFIQQDPPPAAREVTVKVYFAAGQPVEVVVPKWNRASIPVPAAGSVRIESPVPLRCVYRLLPYLDLAALKAP